MYICFIFFVSFSLVSSSSFVRKRTRTRRNNNKINALGECSNKEKYNKIHESLEPVLLLLLRYMKKEKKH